MPQFYKFRRYATLRRSPIRDKFRAKPVHDLATGQSFDSTGECGRWGQLQIMEKAGLISGLELHPKVVLVPERGKANEIAWKVDYRYMRDGRVTYEDYKPRPIQRYEQLYMRLWQHHGPGLLIITGRGGKVLKSVMPVMDEIKGEYMKDVSKRLNELLNEINCRIEHGANGVENLKYVHEKLKLICADTEMDPSKRIAFLEWENETLLELFYKAHEFASANVGEPLKYTTQIPTKPGAYFTRTIGTKRSFLNEVIEYPQGLAIFHQNGGRTFVAGITHFEWAGPIPEPE